MMVARPESTALSTFASPSPRFRVLDRLRDIHASIVDALFSTVVFRRGTQVLRTRSLQFFGRIISSLDICHETPADALMHLLAPLIRRSAATVIVLPVVFRYWWSDRRIGEVAGASRWKAALISLRLTLRDRTGPMQVHGP